MDYLSRHYILGCTEHKEYAGYQYLIEYIKPLMFDKISTDQLKKRDPYDSDDMY